MFLWNNHTHTPPTPILFLLIPREEPVNTTTSWLLPNVDDHNRSIFLTSFTVFSLNKHSLGWCQHMLAQRDNQMPKPICNDSEERMLVWVLNNLGSTLASVPVLISLGTSPIGPSGVLSWQISITKLKTKIKTLNLLVKASRATLDRVMVFLSGIHCRR